MLRFDKAERLVPALVALEDANFGAVASDLIGRAPGEMRIAAAFAAADRSNEFLLLDDEGTPFHCPLATNIPSVDTISENARNWDGNSATVNNLCKTVSQRAPMSGVKRGSKDHQRAAVERM